MVLVLQAVQRRLQQRGCLLALGRRHSRGSSYSTLERQPREKLEEHQEQATDREVVLRYLDGKDNGIAVLGLNRPGARNALGSRLLAQLSEAVERLRRDERLRVLVLRSLVPGVFCAGADLRERARMSPEEAGRFVDALQGLTRKLEALPAPSVAAMDGSALGGGLELALACDLRTAVAGVKLGLVETKLAIIPGAGGTQRLPRLLGPARAKELVFAARLLSGSEAHDLGLVNRLVAQNEASDAAYQEALHLAREILPNGPIAVRMAKVAISKGMEVPLEDGYGIEKQCYAQLLNTEDRIEGLQAFHSKRPPIYRGR
ncbi:enoyl-CoA hydratase domain-containing protein 2, mitochondrial-like [Copidosoma floridanum]|uniref:enoyl-CoA hydratase domain-containing protein 2, mitochondrial-like n=1 Tax=Copidosoma floridanum TaxID=29053 RepID=UPI0006C96BED|nr:enoyl-CoA hydratase domain-containing protein 2, mitochondrial-like [Copidosoma floridanum]XP_014203871.1 enoyl-CoA hydratase domain-containing protein 2, mitochondrial-like [Copidosoma floridanum]XP_014203872.1 enoyl-CoA hydratase domain-containing protein 2, mitochondrial-like [Copidosoma floridanum]